MNLNRDADVSPDMPGVWFRQSRFAGVVRSIVWIIMLVGAPVVGWKFQQPWVLWIGSILAVIVIPLMLMDTAALFRATNWALQIGPEGMWINLRSYKDKVADAVSVVHLDFAEIASAGEHTEVYTTPSNRNTGPYSYGRIGGSIGWRDRFLEIQLNHEVTDELKAALSNRQSQSAPGEGPSGTAQVRNGPCPVWIVSPAVLRIPWITGHGRLILPRLTQALTRLDGDVSVAAPTRRERPDWRNLTADQVDELARELVQVHGATIDATALLVRAGDLSSAEATTRVERYQEEGVRWPEHPV